MSGNHSLTVYFDSLCPVCRREVAVYRRLDHRHSIEWVDLCVAADPQADLPFTIDQALLWLHVTDADGRLLVGFDAHLAMWSRLRGLRWLAGVLRAGFLRRFAEHCYRDFTIRRPGLAMRKEIRRHD